MTKDLKRIILADCDGAYVWKVGKWDWVAFKNKPSQSIREQMKGEGGFYNSRRGVWQFNNGYPSKKSLKPNDYLFSKYGVEEETLPVK